MFSRSFQPLRPVLPLLILLAAQSLWAHPSGKSNTTIHIFPDSLQLLFDCNTNDLANGAGVWGYNNESNSMQNVREKLRNYAFARLPVQMDGITSSDMYIFSWTEDSVDIGGTMDTTALYDSTLLLNIIFPRPPGAKSFTFTPQIFAEYELMAISNTKIYWKGELVAQELLQLDEPLTIPLSPDSLANRAKAMQLKLNPPPPTMTQTMASSLGDGAAHLLAQNGTHLFLFLLLVVLWKSMLGRLLAVLFFPLSGAVGQWLGLSQNLSWAFSSELGMALCVVTAGAALFFGASLKWPWFLLAALAGLWHGVGLAESTRSFGLKPEQFFPLSLGFHLGFLLAGLAAVVVGLLLVWLFPAGSARRGALNTVMAALCVVAGALALASSFLF